jgi:ubiquinone/menaquinone biosynthesis C-methylase UbiE
VSRGNYRKYTSRNPLQRWLVGRFLKEVEKNVAQCLSGRMAHTARILDVGCGEGFVLERLRPRLPDVETFGLDRDLRALAEARARCPDMMAQVADAHELPYPGQSFDVVLCLEVLEHMDNPEKVIDELCRVSRGQVLVSVPHQPYFSLANVLRGKNWARAGDDPDHRHRWRPRAFFELLAGGLDVMHTAYPFPWVLATTRPSRRIGA